MIDLLELLLVHGDLARAHVTAEALPVVELLLVHLLVLVTVHAQRVALEVLELRRPLATVTGAARDLRVQARQRELGLAVVEGPRRLPRGGRVAGVALRRRAILLEPIAVTVVLGVAHLAICLRLRLAE